MLYKELIERMLLRGVVIKAADIFPVSLPIGQVTKWITSSLLLWLSICR